MEKISIARRQWEKNNHLIAFTSKELFPIENEDTQKDQSPVLDSLSSLITEEINVLQTGEMHYMVEILSGMEKEHRLLISIRKLKSTGMERDIYTPDEAANILKVSKKTIYRQLKKRDLQGIKVGSRWRVVLKLQNLLENYRGRND